MRLTLGVAPQVCVRPACLYSFEFPCALDSRRGFLFGGMLIFLLLANHVFVVRFYLSRSAGTNSVSVSISILAKKLKTTTNDQKTPRFVCRGVAIWLAMVQHLAQSRRRVWRWRRSAVPIAASSQIPTSMSSFSLPFYGGASVTVSAVHGAAPRRGVPSRGSYRGVWVWP